MRLDLSNAIDEWFTRCGDGIEFVRCGRADPYAVIGPSRPKSRPTYVYATKTSCILDARQEHPEFDVIGLISRVGLPNAEDVPWISGLIGQGQLVFLGDMDPVDLMVFAWLKARLKHASLTYLGISDGYLSQLGVVVPEAFIMSCAPCERSSLTLLGSVLPDFRELIGPVCAALLDDGRKIELEAVVSSLSPPGPLLLPALQMGE